MRLNNKSFLLLLLLALTAWQPVSVNGITVTINNFRNTKGHVLISLFKDGNGYPDDPLKAIRKEKANITDNHIAIISFTDLPAGQYAAVVLHDENSNVKMDKNWLGLPKEGYGFSNNVMGMFGPPSFSKASFQHKADQQTKITIRMKY
jgi:uncharacterized protein (DUF2141 family)